MADLYEFPFVEGSSAVSLIDGALYIKELPSVEHHFTRFKVQLMPALWKLDTKMDLEDHEWILYTDIKALPFSSGHRKILQHLEGEHAYLAH